MRALVIISGIALVVGVLLRMPVRFHIMSAGDGVKLDARYLLFRFRLAGYEKKEKKKRGKPPKEERAGKAAKKPPRTAKELANTILPLLNAAMGPVWTFVRGLYIRRLHARLYVNKGDAADTALACGQYNAVLYSAYAVLSHLFRFKDVDIVVVPVFYESDFDDRLFVVVTFLPGSLLWCLLKAGYAYIKAMMEQRMQMQKESEQH